MKQFTLLGRFLQFRNELVVLWRAFLDTDTPLRLKALMLLVPLYLLSPIDLIPDFIPIAGWLDDLIIVPLLVNWIVSLLPVRAHANAGRRHDRNDRGDGQTIDGTYRRL